MYDLHLKLLKLFSWKVLIFVYPCCFPLTKHMLNYFKKCIYINTSTMAIHVELHFLKIIVFKREYDNNYIVQYSSSLLYYVNLFEVKMAFLISMLQATADYGMIYYIVIMKVVIKPILPRKNVFKNVSLFPFLTTKRKFKNKESKFLNPIKYKILVTQ